MLNIRATTLEKFRTCKHRYKFEPPRDGTGDYLEFGKALHKYVELIVTNQLNDEAKDLLLLPRGVKQRYMIIQMAEKVKEAVEQRGLTFIMSELGMSHVYEDKDITLEGTMDLLFADKDGNYIIIDIKTAKSNWTEEHAQAVKQKIIYPTLFKKRFNKIIKRFEYRVLTKTTNPELYQFGEDVPEDIEEQVTKVLDELNRANETQIREPNYPNYSCYYCPLKDKCKEYKAIV